MNFHGENYFIITAKLPSLNDYINVCRRNRYQAAQYKRDVEDLIGWNIKRALAMGTLKPPKKPCTVKFKWYERTKRRDYDNIASAKKFILDAMQKFDVIPNDNRKYIRGFADEFYNGDKDCVVVILQEL